MYKRAVRSLAFLGLCLGAGALTWAMSWLIQYICGISIAGQHFHLSDSATNRLAAVTVLATVVIMVALSLIRLLNEWLLFFIIVFCGSAILAGISSVAMHIFPGTTVATDTARVTYDIVVLLWGILMWFIFLQDITEDIADAL